MKTKLNTPINLGTQNLLNFTSSIFLMSILGTFSMFSQCDNWLSTPQYSAKVTIGDMDVLGTQLTVEAMVNRTAPYSGTYIWAGDVVSKHTGPSNVNYLLRPNNAELTTSNGYYCTPEICPIKLNKTYHIAMVYDGSSLKFYRNGFLMSQVTATGNMYQNNLSTCIGLYDGTTTNTQLIGYLNEVRIWNVAKTKEQLRQYMGVPLPSPTTTSNLIAYYRFDDLANKQGNTLWNGTLSPSASINASNPSCNFVVDSCCNNSCILGVDLVNFTAQRRPNGVISISWQTGNDNYLSSLEIEKSDDGISFLPLTKIHAMEKQKSFLDYDSEMTSNKLYYRLKLHHRDGSYSYSNVIIVHSIQEGEISLWPNPVKDKLFIKYNNGQNIDSRSIHIYDSFGSIVNYNIEESTNADVIAVNFRSIKSGIYYVQVIHESVIHNKTVYLVE